MDDIDARQASQIDQLQAAARENRETDVRQWIAITVGLVALFIYTSLILGAVIQNQQSTIRYLEDACSSK